MAGMSPLGTSTRELAKATAKRKEVVTISVLVLLLIGSICLFWFLPKQLPPPHVHVTFEKS